MVRIDFACRESHNRVLRCWTWGGEQCELVIAMGRAGASAQSVMEVRALKPRLSPCDAEMPECLRARVSIQSHQSGAMLSSGFRFWQRHVARLGLRSREGCTLANQRISFQYRANKGQLSTKNRFC